MGFDAMAVAAINATVLAVFFAGATAYAIVLFQGLHYMSTEAIEIANQINSLNWGTIVTSDISYDEHNPQQRRTMASEITRLIMGAGVLTDPHARVEELLHRISLLCSSYPFPTTMHRHDDGTKTIGDKEPVQLSNVEQVRKWAFDVNEVIGSIMWALIQHQNSLWEAVNAHAEAKAEAKETQEMIARLRKVLTPGQQADFERVSSASFGQLAVQDLVVFMNSASAVADATRNKLQQIDRYRARLPKRAFLLSGLIIGTIIFVCGVILPMIEPDSSALLVAWIPGVIYAVSLVGLVVYVAWAYGREATD